MVKQTARLDGKEVSGSGVVEVTTEEAVTIQKAALIMLMQATPEQRLAHVSLPESYTTEHIRAVYQNLPEFDEESLKARDLIVRASRLLTAKMERQTDARALVDAWRDEWHLEPEPEMENGSFQVYESLVNYVASALAAAPASPAAIRDALPTFGYERALTSDWEMHNARRHELIEAERSRSLSEPEIVELAELQWLADIKRELANGPVAIRDETDDLVDEVHHRMDQVVESAVEWHQAGREGTEWFEAAEGLGAAINSLLELRGDPQANMPRRWCSVHNREEFKYESLEHELRSARPRHVGSSRHPHFTHADHERMKETLDALSDYPTEEEAEAALQACGTSGKEVVNEFIERLLKENLELKTKLTAATTSPSTVAHKAAEEIESEEG